MYCPLRSQVLGSKLTHSPLILKHRSEQANDHPEQIQKYEPESRDMGWGIGNRGERARQNTTYLKPNRKGEQSHSGIPFHIEIKGSPTSGATRQVITNIKMKASTKFHHRSEPYSDKQCKRKVIRHHMLEQSPNAQKNRDNHRKKKKR